MTYKDCSYKFYEICEYAGRSDEAIKNLINEILILINNNHIKRFTNENDLNGYLIFESLSKKECN